jgi:hypothetical protein
MRKIGFSAIANQLEYVVKRTIGAKNDDERRHYLPLPAELAALKKALVKISSLRRKLSANDRKGSKEVFRIAAEAERNYQAGLSRIGRNFKHKAGR